MTSAGSIKSLYKGHPINAKGLLSRVDDGVEVGPLGRALALAVDPAAQLTDQNHIGGLASTLRLAVLASISASDRILDVGCGVGGSCRILAACFGARVHGVDINADRVADALRLSRWARLDSQLTFRALDIQAASLLAQTYSVVWSQNAMLHIGAPSQVVLLLSRLLNRHGRLAMEEVCLLRRPKTLPERKLLTELAVLWGGRIYAVEQWRRAFLARKPQALDLEVDGAIVASHLRCLHEAASTPASPWPVSERRGLQLGLELADAGVLGYLRAVARWTSTACPTGT